MGLADKLAAAGIKNASNQGVTEFLSTGYPPLDHRISGKYIGGGVPVGRLTEIAGPPSAGKTAIATNVMVGVQKRGGIAIFMDHEKSFDIELAKSFGLSDHADQWVYQRPDTYEESWDRVKDILYMARGITVHKKEGFLIYGEPMISFDIPIVVVFDSLASMTPQEKFAKRSEDQGMRDKLALASATSSTFDVMSTIAEKTNVSFIFLNQIRTKPGVMYGDNTETPGGNAPEFYCSVRIRLGRSILWDDTTKTKYGQKIGCEVVKNKVTRPFGKTDWEFTFEDNGKGKFQVTAGVIEELCKLGLMDQSGAWISWDGKKWNSRKQLVAHIEEKGQYPDLLALFPK
jgi:RecA/RadA recombinase